MKELGFEPTSYLPALFNCPLCHSKKRMTIYPDPFYKGQWWFCKDCGKCGDMLNLAAELWGTDENIAAKNMKVKGIIADYFYFEEALKLYMFKCLALRKVHNDFWASATNNSLIFESGDLRDALRLLNIPVPKTPEEWKNGMGKLIGLANKKEIEKAIVVPKPEGERKLTRITGSSRPFVGKNWGKMIVIPYFDLPGRIRRFEFINYDDGKLQFANKTLYHGRLLSKVPTFAFFDQIVKDGVEEDLVVVESIEIALSLHARHLKENKPILPLCVVADINTLATHIDLYPYRFTLWNAKLNGDIFKGIKSSNIPVYQTNQNGEWSKFELQKYQPKAWIEKVREGRKKPLEVMEEWLPTVSLIERQAAAGSLDFDTEDSYAIKSELYPTLSETLKSLSYHTGKTIRLSNDQVYEKDDGWYSKRTGSRISPVKIRISKIISGEDKTIHIGELSYAGKVYPFKDEIGQIDADMGEFIRKILIKDNKICISIHNRYMDKLKSLAMMFNPPEIIKQSFNVGWDQSEKAFRFCNFMVGRKGEVFEATAMSTSEEFPTATIKYEPVNLVDINKLTNNTTTNRSFWALTAAMTSAVMTTATGIVPKRFAYYGETGSATDVVCEWFGIPPTSHKDINAEKTYWPIVVPKKKRSWLASDFDSWFVLKKKPQCFIETDKLEAYIMHLFAPATTVLKIDLDSHLGEIEEAAKKILPNFLAYVLKTEDISFDHEEGMALGLLNKAADWVESFGVSSDVVKEAKKCFKATVSKVSNGCLTAFTELCQYGIAHRFLIEGSTVDSDVMLTTKTAKIDKERFYEILKREGFRLADGLDIQRYLDDTANPGSKLNYSEAESSDKFIVDRAWWEATMRDSRDVKTLKIAR